MYMNKLMFNDTGSLKGVNSNKNYKLLSFCLTVHNYQQSFLEEFNLEYDSSMLLIWIVNLLDIDLL